MAGYIFERHIESDLERFFAARGLGKKQTSLNGGQHADRKIPRDDRLLEFAVLLHFRKAFGQPVFPCMKAGNEQRTGLL